MVDKIRGDMLLLRKNFQRLNFYRVVANEVTIVKQSTSLQRIAL